MKNKDVIILRKILTYCDEMFAHQYANIDYKIAWDTIQEDVPLLKAKIEEILDKI